MLGHWHGQKYLGMNLSKYGAAALRTYLPRLRDLILQLLEKDELLILNIFTRQFGFQHWPKERRAEREAAVSEEASLFLEMERWSTRIISIIDEPIPVVAAILRKTSYFVGVDNGIKHLAWALGVPTTTLFPVRPNPDFILRWVPDYHSSVDLNCRVVDVLNPILQTLQGT